MAEVNEIREKLANYLAKKMSLADFEDWFVANSWNVHQSDNLEARNLVHGVELRLSELSSGHLTEDGLRKELAPFVTSISNVVIFGNATVATSSGPDVNWIPVGELLFAAPADKESAVVFESRELHL